MNPMNQEVQYYNEEKYSSDSLQRASVATSGFGNPRLSTERPLSMFMLEK